MIKKWALKFWLWWLFFQKVTKIAFYQRNARNILQEKPIIEGLQNDKLKMLRNFLQRQTVYFILLYVIYFTINVFNF